MKIESLKTIVRRFAVVALIAVSMSFQMSADDIFSELSSIKSVESVYVSGRFSKNMKIWRNNSNTRAMDLSRGFSALYSYRCYSEESVKKARNLLNTYLKNNPNVEVMMHSKEISSEYIVYERFNEFDSEVRCDQMIIWSSDAPNVCEVVVIDWKKGLGRGGETYSDYEKNK